MEFCSEIEMVITRTLFKHKHIQKGTWVSSDHTTVNKIDPVMMNVKYRGSVLDTTARRGADHDIGSDHELLTSTMKLQLKRTDKKPQINEQGVT